MSQVGHEKMEWTPRQTANGAQRQIWPNMFFVYLAMVADAQGSTVSEGSPKTMPDLHDVC